MRRRFERDGKGPSVTGMEMHLKARQVGESVGEKYLNELVKLIVTFTGAIEYKHINKRIPHRLCR